MYDIECTVPPTGTGLDIISLDEMKRHLRVEDSAADDDVKDAVNDAVAYLDGIGGILNRSVLQRTWRLYRSAFSKGPVIELPYPNVLEVSAVEYRDTGGTLQPLDPALYIVRDNLAPGEIELIDAYAWPSTLKHPRAIQITYTAGYEVYPDNLKRAVKFLAAHYYGNREATTRGQADATNKLEFGLDHLLSGLVVPHAFGGCQ